MAASIDSLDLAALLCSRVCHDLIGPVAALVNGLEVMEDDKDAETQKLAIDLIKKSVGQASARLQFCRIAFGAAGSAGAQIDLADAQKVARNFLEDDKTKIAWNLPPALLPKNRVKLLLNMLVIGSQAIPRGGNLTVDPVGQGDAMGFRVTAAGTNARVAPAVASLLAGTPADGVDAHAIQPYYTGLLAKACGLAVSAASEGEAVVVSAR
jgi:histidine phosphotransferase ChpT